MALWTLVIYDIKTESDNGKALNEFQEFITDECKFHKLQNSAYYKKDFDYRYLLDEIRSLPHGSIVNITCLDDDQFRKLKINRVT